MSKHEGNWEAVGRASEVELPAPLAGIAGTRRDDALIRFLAGFEDWQAAGRRLSGAFAEDEAVQLRREQEE